MLSLRKFNVRYLEYKRTNGVLVFTFTKFHSFSEQIKDRRSTIAEIDAKIRFKLYEERCFSDEHLADCVIFNSKTLVSDDEFLQCFLKKWGRNSQPTLNEVIKKNFNSKELLGFIFIDAENWGNIPNETQVSLPDEAYHFLVIREIDSHLFIPIEAMFQNTRFIDIPEPHQSDLNPDFNKFDSNAENYVSTENNPPTQIHLPQ
ncbi:hypothetical protein HK096_005440, partial [Nowakowskiella sp. JEL0078]